MTVIRSSRALRKAFRDGKLLVPGAEMSENELVIDLPNGGKLHVQAVDGPYLHVTALQPGEQNGEVVNPL